MGRKEALYLGVGSFPPVHHSLHFPTEAVFAGGGVWGGNGSTLACFAGIVMVCAVNTTEQEWMFV